MEHLITPAPVRSCPKIRVGVDTQIDSGSNFEVRRQNLELENVKLARICGIEHQREGSYREKDRVRKRRRSAEGALIVWVNIICT